MLPILDCKVTLDLIAVCDSMLYKVWIISMSMNMTILVMKQLLLGEEYVGVTILCSWSVINVVWKDVLYYNTNQSLLDEWMKLFLFY